MECVPSEIVLQVMDHVGIVHECAMLAMTCKTMHGVFTEWGGAHRATRMNWSQARSTVDKPLVQAAHAGYASVCKYLLMQTSHTPSYECRTQALRVAASAGWVDVCRLLLDHSPGLCSSAWTCPLLMAAESGQLAAMIEIRRHTPAHHRNNVVIALARQGLLRQCQWMLEHDPWMCAGTLNTARQAAAVGRHMDVVCLLDACMRRRALGMRCGT
jgi:hypothetical protein